MAKKELYSQGKPKKGTGKAVPKSRGGAKTRKPDPLEGALVKRALRAKKINPKLGGLSR